MASRPRGEGFVLKVAVLAEEFGIQVCAMPTALTGAGGAIAGAVDAKVLMLWLVVAGLLAAAAAGARGRLRAQHGSQHRRGTHRHPHPRE